MVFRPRYPMQLLVSLVAASLLWYALAAERNENISVRGMRATLTLVNMPADLVLTSSVPDTVAVQLRGPLSRAFDPTSRLEMLVDLADARPGSLTYTLSESDLTLPSEVELVSVDPTSISLELERLRTRYIPVEAVVEGAPAPGFEVLATRALPAQLAVQGPDSRLSALAVVQTTPLSIEGATSTVEATVQPRLGDPLLRSLAVAPLVVTVEIGATEVPGPGTTSNRRP